VQVLHRFGDPRLLAEPFDDLDDDGARVLDAA
jgi:hypothetical protein